MLKYIIRRIILAIPVLLGVSVVSFMIISLAPGDFLDSYRLNPAVNADQVKNLERQFGLDKSPVVQYFLWLRNMLQGEWGQSFTYQIPVWDLIWRRVGATLLLSITTFIFTWGIGIPLGIYAALHQYSLGDQIVGVIGFIGLSIPNFFFALLFLFFAARTGGKIFPVGGFISLDYDTFPVWKKALDIFWHVLGPMITLGTSGLAGTMRIMRGQLLDELKQDYVEFARAKGMPENVVIYKHALRNAINPIITALGFSISGLLGGAVLTENVFGWPGMGQLIIEALLQQDIFVIMANLMLVSLMLVIGNLIADILLAAVDPRVRLRLG
ncbi:MULTISPECIES: ABC transporter permease [unclassified Marinitoga]|uniref:ABC transporter permease n=1 Tax=unclassified Marinitoga TaxID=2640159 RepID=UPI000640ED30|nr:MULTISPECIES: ABC transporter permease [unclassified Marinitoga]KLO23397.1 ABC transporter substrate-binding protein [Marinitoga sp. 1155]NUV00302.1 ABC transporter substrate-binding protein [Marinitoga sp. 1154]